MTTIEDPPAGSVHPAAAALIAARRRGVTVPAVDPGDAASAYRVQREVDAALFDRDGAPRAWKSGGASREAPRTHAPLPPGGVRASPADLRDLRVSLRRIEAEVALRLARDVDAATAAGIGAGDAAAIVDAMAAAIELVDSRWAEGLDAPPFARLADLQSHGALVLGEWVPFAPRD
ncbi:MAG TPA: 2-keto-4-pentenoate hydratase, partial [Burkholderiaceae bacterium]|nr:2-keto-4-pentenoate hydratase [Burkholderiaceae bacterium]